MDEQNIDNINKQVLRRELAEPEEAKNPWPYAVWLFFGVMIGWGVTYLALESGSGEMMGGDLRSIESKTVSTSEEEIKVDGSVVYKNVCMVCHQQTGLGLPGAFPPLVGSEWIKDSKIPVKIILKGLQGPIEVKGSSYNGVMPAFESQLKDNEIAAVVNYVRHEWGNKFEDQISSKEVAEIRESLKTKTDSWTAGDLIK